MPFMQKLIDLLVLAILEVVLLRCFELLINSRNLVVYRKHEEDSIGHSGHHAQYRNSICLPTLRT